MAKLSAKVRAEEEGLCAFLTALKAGPATADASVTDPSARASAVRDFYDKVATRLETQRSLLREIRRATEDGGRQKMFAALRWELHALRSESSLPELLPAWQLAFAVEGLLKQFADNAANVTSSALRTLEGGLELLGDICRPGVEAGHLTRQPLKLLVVDDDPISRTAVAVALRRGLSEPALAKDSEAALALAMTQSYDVIFLNVETPKIDGFELCSRIHETALNPETPVVFVTSHTDFEARAKSALDAGSELIGKPFLTFEITVKALTLALRARLVQCAQGNTSSETLNETSEVANSSVAIATEANRDCAQTSLMFLTSPVARPSSEEDEIATEFLTRASVQLSPLQEALQAIFQVSDEATRRGLLLEVFMRIHSFTPKADQQALHPAIQLGTALEALLNKLLESPGSATESALVAVANGVEMLHELCVMGLRSDLLTNPPLRMLVVDDDTASRRVVSGALQLSYEKPENAESGDAALTLAADRNYDVIFLDALMPGMDGFETCERIRQTAANRLTPVVFIISKSDSEARHRMRVSGGNDFVEKPCLTPELTLKALTFALRNRLENFKTRQCQWTTA